MPHLSHLSRTLICVWLVATAVLPGCSSRKIITVVEDQQFVPGPAPQAQVPVAAEAATAVPPPVAEAVLPEPPPPPPAVALTPEPQEAPVVAPAQPPEEPTKPEVPPTTPSMVAEVPVAEPPIAQAPPQPAPPPAPPAADLSDIFFDFDQFLIRGDAKAALEANARLLKSDPGRKILIEGHCDERGTGAYNLVLGERRAQAAKRYLQDVGVAPSQIQITSYGKERPFCTEHSEACWQANRRAHFTKQ